MIQHQPSVAERKAPQPVPQTQAAQPALAADVIQQLGSKFGQKDEQHDQRQSERHPWTVHLTVIIEDPAGKPRTLEIVTHDISAGGFSFIYRQFMHLGTKVRVQVVSLEGRPTLDGVIRNCTYLGGMNHRIGVQFVTAKEGACTPRRGPTG